MHPRQHPAPAIPSPEAELKGKLYFHSKSRKPLRFFNPVPKTETLISLFSARPQGDASNPKTPPHASPVFHRSPEPAETEQLKVVSRNVYSPGSARHPTFPRQPF